MGVISHGDICPMFLCLNETSGTSSAPQTCDQRPYALLQPGSVLDTWG